ncbi:MAG: methylated-DNA--[protein]-cysteine S-methyltransferase, partial [Burkholderiales bacterium]|nr:methylated-DNA--[protein]-cysteine S-methyltransferase [Burkholderiales bacterium]
MKYTVNFQFPTFGLQIFHNGEILLSARFFNPMLEHLPVYDGGDSNLSVKIVEQLESYVKNPNFKFDLPYELNGSPHQLKVWDLMETLESGIVLTYGEVAKEIRSAPRAVGGACGKNPLPVFVPCHRIIAANHGLGGFNSGNIFFNLGIKKWLLEHEGVKIK